MTDSSDPDGSPAGVSRRQILKRSALIGGTALWVAPTVLTITAAVPPGSDPHPGDGSPLCADYYLLLFRCGGAYYLVKVMKDPNDRTKLKIISGSDLFLEDDQWHAKPGNKKKETDVSRLRKQYNCRLDLPIAVTYYTSQGGLCVDLGRIMVMDPVVTPKPPKHGHSTPTATPSPTYHYENSCSIVAWFVQAGRTYGTQWTTPKLGPIPPDGDTPQIVCFQCCKPT